MIDREFDNYMLGGSVVLIVLGIVVLYVLWD